jgi:NAD-dependent deacetylase sirtuin 2
LTEPAAHPRCRYKPTPTHCFIKLLHDKGLLRRCFSQNIDSLETATGLPAEKVGT